MGKTDGERLCRATVLVLPGAPRGRAPSAARGAAGAVLKIPRFTGENRRGGSFRRATLFRLFLRLQLLRRDGEFAAGDALVERLFRDRFAEQVPLQAVAADPVQELRLHLRLDALGQGEHMDPVRHLDDAVDQDLRLFAVFEVREEPHIEFDDVELVVLQDVQGRIPAAEIVEPERVAEFLDAVDRLGQFRHTVGQGALGHFDVDQILRETVLFHQFVEFPDGVHQFEVEPREVERHRHDRFARVKRRAQIAAGELEDRAVEFVDQAVFLKHGDKLVREELPVGRVHPAGEHLAAAEFFRIRPDDRLIVRDDPAVCHRVVDIVDDVEPLAVRLAHLLVVFDINRLEAVLDQMRRVARAVDAVARILAARVQAVAAAVDPEQDLVVVGADLLVESAEPFFQPRPLRHHDEMVVRLPPVERIREDVRKVAADRAEEAVARLEPSLIVERLEVVDVDEEQDVFGNVALRRADASGREFGEVVVVPEPGQAILFGALLEFLRFARLFEPPVVDREADGRQRDEEGQVVDGVARNDLVHHAADLDVLRLKGHPAVEGQKDAVEAEEARPEDQDGDIRAVDEQAPDVNDHRQKADDLFPAPEIAVRNENAESEANEVERRDRHVLEDHDPLAF